MIRISSGLLYFLLSVLFARDYMPAPVVPKNAHGPVPRLSLETLFHILQFPSALPAVFCPLPHLLPRYDISLDILGDTLGYLRYVLYG
jgi:hypothetical protein